jgi:hypothetical protein
MYQIFKFTPPELSQSEKVWLGKEILKVGPDVFAKALKNRMANANKPFTWIDVFEDIRNPAPEKMSKTTAAVVVAAAGAACVTFIPAVSLLAVGAVIGPIMGGSYFWMARKIDLWIRNLIAVAATETIQKAA